MEDLFMKDVESTIPENDKKAAPTRYLVMREEGLRTDGYYYEAKTTILGSFYEEKDACSFLKEVAKILYADEKPLSGTYNLNGDTQMVFGDSELQDIIWVEPVISHTLSYALTRLQNGILKHD